MLILKAIIELVMVLLLVRLLIPPNEARFHPIYRLMYRVTDPVLTPSRYITRTALQGVLVTVVALVVLRGALYTWVAPVPFAPAVGASFLELFQLLFQAYVVMWVISALAGRGYGTPAIHLMARAFLPVDAVLGRLGVPRRHFLLASFLLLWVLYAILSDAVQSILILQDMPSPVSVARSLGAGLLVVLGLFPFPGFFSVVLIVGALLSWVSPDPRNPIVQTIYGITEPLLAPFRRFLPNLGGIDLSPILALLAFQFLGGMAQQLVAEVLRELK
jgi:YggT family protein